MHTIVRAGLVALILLTLLDAKSIYAAKCPHVLIVLDASSSMNQAPDGKSPMPPNGISKWDISKKALHDLLTGFNNKFPIGLSLFRAQTLIGCEVNSTPEVPILYDTAQRIDSYLASIANPDGGTPTYYAISKARANTSLQEPDRGEYIVLITDGAPECDLPQGEGVPRTVNEIKAAFDGTPSIKTFVIGFGSLPTDQQSALNLMADAGGVPAPTTSSSTDRFYKADSAAALFQALNGIFQTIATGDVGMNEVCDDSCYSNKCPTNQSCVQGVCLNNPCANYNCPQNEYCYTDGTSAPTCKKVCNSSCPSGQRCILGQCLASACALACADRQLCKDATGACEADATCNGIKCHTSQGCRNGRCIDDPCTFIRCPGASQCVPFEGTCTGDINSGGLANGCSCDLTPQSNLPSILPAILCALVTWGLMRRRRPAYSSLRK